MTASYSDDRYGMMRVHIADERSRLAGHRFTRNTLRAHANGNLRDGFPEAGEP